MFPAPSKAGPFFIMGLFFVGMIAGFFGGLFLFAALSITKDDD